MDLTCHVLCRIALYSIGLCFYHQSHPQLGIVFALAPFLHSFWSYFSTDPVAYWAPNDLGSSSFGILMLETKETLRSVLKQFFLVIYQFAGNGYMAKKLKSFWKSSVAQGSKLGRLVPIKEKACWALSGNY